MKKEHFKPGEACQISGIYRLANADGKVVKPLSERTVVKDEPFPPAEAHGETYVLYKAAKHHK